MERILILHDYAGRRGEAELLALDLRRLLRARGYDAQLMKSTPIPLPNRTRPTSSATARRDDSVH